MTQVATLEPKLKYFHTKVDRYILLFIIICLKIGMFQETTMSKATINGRFGVIIIVIEGN